MSSVGAGLVVSAYATCFVSLIGRGGRESSAPLVLSSGNHSGGTRQSLYSEEEKN